MINSSLQANSTIEHCLSQKTSEHYQVRFSIETMVIINADDLLKLVCMLPQLLVATHLLLSHWVIPPSLFSRTRILILLDNMRSQSDALLRTKSDTKGGLKVANLAIRWSHQNLNNGMASSLDGFTAHQASAGGMLLYLWSVYVTTTRNIPSMILVSW